MGGHRNLRSRGITEYPVTAITVTRCTERIVAARDIRRSARLCWSSIKTLATPIRALCGPAGVVIAEHRCGAGHQRLAIVARAGRTHAEDVLSVYRFAPQVLVAVSDGASHNHASIVNQGWRWMLRLREAALGRL